MMYNVRIIMISKLAQNYFTRQNFITWFHPGQQKITWKINLKINCCLRMKKFCSWSRIWPLHWTGLLYFVDIVLYRLQWLYIYVDIKFEYIIQDKFENYSLSTYENVIRMCFIVVLWSQTVYRIRLHEYSNISSFL